MPLVPIIPQHVIDEYIRLVDDVNNSKLCHRSYYEGLLRGFGMACEMTIGDHVHGRLAIIADQTQFARGHEDTPMCGGVFI
jgi:hypothetical protein